MRILFAGDDQPYSAFALKKVVELARHTWANVNLLAVHSTLPRQTGNAEPWSPDTPVNRALYNYRDEFLRSWEGEESPYEQKEVGFEWLPMKGGAWEQVKVARGSKKDLKIRSRAGGPVAEILSEAREEGVDIIVLGCTKGDQCDWKDPPGLPQKIVNDASCSVLLVKEDQPIKRIIACIDQTVISQASLEMINQMVTIYNAELELIGLTRGGGAKSEAYTRLIEVGDYYGDRQVKVKSSLTDINEFEHFIARETREDLLALFMGNKSILDRFFPRDWVGRFVGTCRTSVLVLR